MINPVTLKISEEALRGAADQARQCASSAAQERVLVSQACSLAIREHLLETGGLSTTDWRSGSTKYIELLDLCDFRTAGGWTVEVRVITPAEREALHVPTMPLMVGVFSDYYLSVQVNNSLTEAAIFGYATRNDLAEADLTSNGLFAVLPNDELHPFNELTTRLRESAPIESGKFSRFDEWRGRAEQIMNGVRDVLAAENALMPEQVKRLTEGLRDDILRIYGEKLPATDLEPLLEKLFQRFGVETPVPSAPDEPVAFSNSTRAQERLAGGDVQRRFFRNDTGVSERVSLYRYLLEEDTALEDHRRMKKTLDHLSDGGQGRSPRERAKRRAVRKAKVETAWIEPPPRPSQQAVTTNGIEVGESTMNQTTDAVVTGGADAAQQVVDDLHFEPGQRVEMPGHFTGTVVVEEVRKLGSAYECRVRLADGSLVEEVVTAEEARAIFKSAAISNRLAPVDADHLRLYIESARIRLAYAHDRQFAVSLSGIRTLPHQIEAVYMRMLPQPRLRFLLADDPGAGKTIMAGLLVKEMKLRQAIERVLILSPAPLTLQWQDELLRWFNEPFEIITSASDQQQLLNPWQRASQVIASLDYAKQDEVRERVWQQHWDLVIIDEAHKCSAYTKQSTQSSPQSEKTKRYQLAEKLTAEADHVLLLTATPHHGDDDRFGNFLRLVDPDLFPEPHKMGAKAAEIRRNVLKLGRDCPWALRRLKEDLRDMDGKRLFPERETKTMSFKLNPDEYALYREVTQYINEYMPQSGGKQKASVALARTVFQRRLASSTSAIYESLKRRLEKQQTLLEALELLPPKDQARRLAQLQGRLVDAEQDEGDLDEAARDAIFDNFTSAGEVENLRAEVFMLRELNARAKRVRDQATDSKLTALKQCLEQAEFQDLRNGDNQSRLLLFTEHRDTLNYVRNKLVEWGYTVCEIHGGMNVHQRKKAQEEFRTRAQICVATEAAGEGINLQFCHLMINYDMPWNPTRLEQRLGRIHRIGQKKKVYCYNFVATESETGEPVIEGRILERLLQKLEQMKEALEGRVYDVIGEVLSINDVNLPQMIQEATFNPGRLEEKLDDLASIDPEKWRQYEEATGVALARDMFDVDRFKRFQDQNFEVEERRLMPKYVEEQFRKIAPLVGLRTETRADGLLRIEHVIQDLRSDRWESARRLGKPNSEYRKVTFDKEVFDKEANFDAELVGPGHPLYSVVDESFNEKMSGLAGGTGVYLDEYAEAPYKIQFFEMEIKGQPLKDGNTRGRRNELYAELVAVKEEGGAFEIIPASVIQNLPSHTSPPASIQPQDVNRAADFLKSTYQLEKRSECRIEREKFVSICRDYLTRSFEARIRAAQDRTMRLQLRAQDESDSKFARDNAMRDLAELRRSKDDRLEGLARLEVAQTGPVRHVGTALVLTCAEAVEDQMGELCGIVVDVAARRASELAAEDVVARHEESHGWTTERVGNMKIGFDIRSISPADAASGVRDVRRIEVKGRTQGGAIRLTTNEWLQASQLRETYWLYVVWNPTGANPVLHKIQDPARVLDHAKREVITARVIELDAESISEAARKCEDARG